jgi:hypothetical protein
MASLRIGSRPTTSTLIGSFSAGPTQADTSTTRQANRIFDSFMFEHSNRLQ